MARMELTPTSWKCEKWLHPWVISLSLLLPSLPHHPCLSPGYWPRRSLRGSSKSGCGSRPCKHNVGLETPKSWPTGTSWRQHSPPTVSWWNWQPTRPCLLLCLLALGQPQFLSGIVHLLPTDPVKAGATDGYYVWGSSLWWGEKGEYLQKLVCRTSFSLHFRREVM